MQLTYKKIIMRAMRITGMKWSQEMEWDATSHLWESENRYTESIGALSRPLSEEEKSHLNRILLRRAIGAVIDYVRFKTGYRKGDSKKANGSGLIRLDYVALSLHNGTCFETTIVNKMDLFDMEDFDLIQSYILGKTLAEIGKELGLTEAAISLRFKKKFGSINLRSGAGSANNSFKKNIDSSDSF